MTKGLTKQRLTDAINSALKVGSALEMEFDESSYNNANKHDEALEHIEAYNDAFERYGVWKNASVAYYLGGTVWGDMAKSSRSRDRQVLEKLARHIADRHSTLSTTKAPAATTQSNTSNSTTTNTEKTEKKKWWQLDWHF